MKNSEPMRLLRIHQVEDLVGLKKSAIYTHMEKGSFPRPVCVGARVVAWRALDIASWINDRPYKGV